MGKPPLHLNEDPQRLLEGNSTLSPLARDLLRAMPPVKPLDANVALRVRTTVLQSSGAPVNPGPAAGSVRPSPSVAYVKLGAVAGTAALFGAGVMTLVSSVVNAPAGQFGAPNDRSGVVVVSATGPRGASHLDAKTLAANALTTKTTAASDGAQAYGGPADATTLAGSTGDKPTAPASVVDAVVAEANALREQAADDLGRRDGESSGARAGTTEAELGARGQVSAGATGAPADTDLVLSVDDLQAADEQLFTGQRANHDGRVMVRPAFRRIASSADSGATPSSHRKSSLRTLAITSLEQETILLEEARTKLGRDPEAALELALEHQSRFRRGQLLEQRRMIHLEALLRLGRDLEAQDLAKSIGSSLYQARAQALLEKYGI